MILQVTFELCYTGVYFNFVPPPPFLSDKKKIKRKGGGGGTFETNEIIKFFAIITIVIFILFCRLLKEQTYFIHPTFADIFYTL